MGIFDGIINKLSKTKYKCNNDGCGKYFDVNKRYDELKSKLPESSIIELGSFMGFCSDKCFQTDHDMEDIVQRFTDQ